MDLARNASAPAQVDVQGATTTAYIPASTASTPPAGWQPIHPSPQVVIRDNPPRPDVPASLQGGWNQVPPGGPGTGAAGQVVAMSSGMAGSGQAVPTPAASRAPSAPAAPLKVVNTNRVTLDYEVAKFGPSGVRGVELYATRDEGRTWQRIGEQNIEAPQPQELQGPARTMRRSLTVDLQDDGIYGFYLVVKSGAGLGKPPPQGGEAAQMRVEVDRVAPEAELYRPAPDPRRRDALVLRWAARDRNLAANPVTLEWARQPSGPWELIGPPELPNTGHYVWQVPPANMPPQVYLRLTVRDTAGNRGVAETPEPILIDLAEPEVRLIDVTPPSPR
jgi:hypothetical protein